MTRTEEGTYTDKCNHILWYWSHGEDGADCTKMKCVQTGSKELCITNTEEKALEQNSI